MTIARPILTGLFAVALLAGCSSKKEPAAQNEKEPVAQKESSSARSDERPPADFACTVGEGGGVTGVWKGYSMDAEGAVRIWKGATEGANPEPAGRVPREERRRLWGLVKEKKFMTMSPGAPGNMTYFLEVTADSKTLRVQWSDMIGSNATPDQATVKELRATFFEALVKAESNTR